MTADFGDTTYNDTLCGNLETQARFGAYFVSHSEFINIYGSDGILLTTLTTADYGENEFYEALDWVRCRNEDYDLHEHHLDRYYFPKISPVFVIIDELRKSNRINEISTCIQLTQHIFGDSDYLDRYIKKHILREIESGNCDAAQILNVCDSVLEQMFISSLMIADGVDNGTCCPDNKTISFNISQVGAIDISLQYKIGKYTVDFYVDCNGKKIVIEMDGHEFHSSKEALRKDKERDRELQKLGYIVFRYTYQDIVNEAEKHISELIEFIADGN